MKQKQVTIENAFHGKELKTSIKAEYLGDPSFDAVTMLSMAAHHGDAYAKRKLRTIKNTLCGSNSCTCGAFYKIV
jgi:hypothetical protein